MIRLVWRAAGILGGFLACVPLHFAWKLAGARSPWPRRFLGWAGRRCALRVRIEGVPLTGNVLYAANHFSWLDILALGGGVPARFVARADVAGWLGVGWAAKLNDTIFIARDLRHTVHDQADALRRALGEGRAVALFPEGTTDAGRALLPFRPSLFASLFPPLEGVLVQPVAIDYGAAFGFAQWVGDEDYGPNAKRILSRPGTIPVVLRFLEPIDPHAAGDRKVLAARCQAEVEEALAASAPPHLPL
jgi:1-acyl-sn-glycerol-3-phosphate acyltransferase